MAIAALIELGVEALALLLEALEVELAAELVELAACSACSRVCRSLLSLLGGLEGGGGGGGGALGGATLTAELAEDAELALELELELEALAAWPAAASRACSACQDDEPLEGPRDPMDMTCAFLRPRGAQTGRGV